MPARRLIALTALALAGTLAGAAPSFAGTPAPDRERERSFAVIGDVPYGADQVAAFPRWVDQINAADPALTFHVGDIKNGSTRCDEPYYRTIRADFDRFENPLVYTPGDNEWTDCHRENNGGYAPLDRLALDRQVFFDHPGTTLGRHPARVTSSAGAGFPENVRLRRSDVDFAVVHVVGSNDDLQPWSGLGQSTATRDQVAEEQARMADSIAVVREAFAQARRRHDRAVVVMQQADMFDPTYTPAWTDISAFQPLVQALTDEASRFAGPVYLFNGDSHVFHTDRPLAAGSPWLATYGVRGSADNLQRVTVDGSSNNTDWLRVTVTRPGTADVLRWERIPYTG